MLQAGVVVAGSATLHAMDNVAFFQQELCQIRAILARDTSNQSNLRRSHFDSINGRTSPKPDFSGALLAFRGKIAITLGYTHRQLGPSSQTPNTFRMLHAQPLSMSLHKQTCCCSLPPTLLHQGSAMLPIRAGALGTCDERLAKAGLKWLVKACSDLRWLATIGKRCRCNN